MLGKELIQAIKENHLEDYDFKLEYVSGGCLMDVEPLTEDYIVWGKDDKAKSVILKVN